MEKTKKIKLYIGLFYLLFIGLFLYYFFSKFSIGEITSYDFIKNNRDYFFELKKSNLFLLTIIFFTNKFSSDLLSFSFATILFKIVSINNNTSDLKFYLTLP